MHAQRCRMISSGPVASSESFGHIVTLRLYEDAPFPNNAVLPVLLYHGAFALDGVADAPALIERTFHKNGWSNGWRNGIYEFHHYHSTAHEVLGCYSGRARAQLGGPGGPIVTLAAGDVLVLPAGVSHKKIDSSSDFAVVGCYAHGADYDMNSGDDDERPAADERIARLRLPDADPVYGPSGPLCSHWRA